MNEKINNIALIEAREAEAIALFQDGKTTEAIAVLKSIWDECFEQPPYLHDTDSRAWRTCVSIIALLRKQEKYEEALPWALYATQFSNRIVDSDCITAGEIYLKLGKEAEAFQMFDKAYQSGKKRAFQNKDTAWQFYNEYKKQ